MVVSRSRLVGLPEVREYTPAVDYRLFWLACVQGRSKSTITTVWKGCAFPSRT
jgi:hypothetical protein